MESAHAELPQASPKLLNAQHQRLIWMVIGGLFVFAVSLWQNFAQFPISNFHPDESRWIDRAEYLRELSNPLGDQWSDAYLIRGQPPFGSYVTGIGLLLQGQDLNTNGPWDFRYGLERNFTWNATYGNMPTRDDLEAARNLTALLGAGSALMLFLLISRFTNVIGGVVGGLMLAFHPLHTYLSTLATADALFTFLVALTGLAAYWLARKPGWWRAGLLTLALAAGASTKLSPIFITAPLAVLGAWLLLESRFLRIQSLARITSWIDRDQPGTHSRLGWMLLVQPVTVAALFILSYPFLWPAPLERTRLIFELRREEMRNQSVIWPRAAIDNPIEALDRIWIRLTYFSSTTGRLREWLGIQVDRQWESTGFEVPFAVAGIAVLIVLAWQRGIASPTALAALVLLSQAALIVLGLGVDFDRYYLPLVFVNCIGIGVLTGTVWSLLVRFFNRQTATRTPEQALSDGAAATLASSHQR